jgi:hypothetical protein
MNINDEYQKDTLCKKITKKFAPHLAQAQFAPTYHYCTPARTRWQPYPSKLGTRNSELFSSGLAQVGKKWEITGKNHPLEDIY